MSEDSKKKKRRSSAQALQDPQKSPAPKGAVQLTEEKKKKAAYTIDASDSAALGADFVEENTDPEAPSMTIESLPTHTLIDSNDAVVPDAHTAASDKPADWAREEKEKRAETLQAALKTSEVLKPQSSIKKPPSTAVQKAKAKAKAQAGTQKKKIQRETPELDMNAIDALPQALFKKAKTVSAKRSQPDKEKRAAGPRFSGLTPHSGERLPPRPKEKPQKPAPPSKEKLSHATQIFVQDALAAVDLLDGNEPPKESPPPKKVETTQANVNFLAEELTNPEAAKEASVSQKSKAERIQREWGRALEGPEAKRAENREGKVLDQEPPRYQKDKRPLAYRGAWWVGQPDIRPKRLPRMVQAVLKRGRGEKRFLWGSLVASLVFGSIFIGPQFFNPGAKAMAWQSGMKVEISSAPSGADVFVDDVHLGKTPLALRKDLAPGGHVVRLKYQKLIPVVQKITTNVAQDHLQLHLPFQDVSSLYLKTTPTGADVLREGQKVGQTPLRLNALPLTEAIEIEIIKEGFLRETVYLPKSRSLTDEKTLQLYPQDSSGKVTLQAPKELLVYKGAKQLGITGPAPITLPAGDHQLEFVEPITGQKEDVFVRVVAKATRRYYFDWSDAP